MSRFVTIAGLVILALAILAGGCQAKFQPGAFTDDYGRTITVDKAPQRLVSHVPSITETLFALGLGDRIVGVSDWDKYPPEAKSKTSVGNYFNPSVELVVAQAPDLVLTDGHSGDMAKKLDSLKINFVVIDPKDVDGMLRDIELLGKITGVEAAATKLVRSMKDDMAGVTRQVEGASRPKVFYILDAKADPANPWTVGPGSFQDYLINAAGGENVASVTGAAYAQLSMEALVKADPDIIVIAGAADEPVITEQELKQSPVWGQMRAVKGNRVFRFNADLANPTPRIAQGLREMAKIIHPDLVR